MKKKTKNIVKTGLTGAIGIISIGLAQTSCNTDYYNLDDNLYGNFAPNTKSGETFFNLSMMGYTDDVVNYTRAITVLIQQFTLDEAAALQFQQNPELYVNDVKKQLNINLTQDDVTFLKAFTDPEIRTAILNNDLKAFLNVTVKKGYNKSQLSISKVPLRDRFKTEKDYNAYLQRLEQYEQKYGPLPGPLENDAIAPRQAVEVPLVAVTIGGAVEAIVAHEEVAVDEAYLVHENGYAVTDEGAINTETAINNESWVWNTENLFWGESSKAMMMRGLNKSVPTLRLWTDNFNEMDSEKIYKVLVDEPVEQIMEVFYPEASDKFKEETKALLKRKLEANYGISM